MSATAPRTQSVGRRVQPDGVVRSGSQISGIIMLRWPHTPIRPMPPWRPSCYR